jgi:hypothetical protein
MRVRSKTSRIAAASLQQSGSSVSDSTPPTSQSDIVIEWPLTLTDRSIMWMPCVGSSASSNASSQ